MVICKKHIESKNIYKFDDISAMGDDFQDKTKYQDITLNEYEVSEAKANLTQTVLANYDKQKTKAKNIEFSVKVSVNSQQTEIKFTQFAVEDLLNLCINKYNVLAIYEADNDNILDPREFTGGKFILRLNEGGQAILLTKQKLGAMYNAITSLRTTYWAMYKNQKLTQINSAKTLAELEAINVALDTIRIDYTDFGYLHNDKNLFKEPEIYVPPLTTLQESTRTPFNTVSFK